MGNFATFLSPVVQDDELVGDGNARSQKVFDCPNDVMVAHVLAQIPLGIDRQDARMFSPLRLPLTMKGKEIVRVCRQQGVAMLGAKFKMVSIAET